MLTRIDFSGLSAADSGGAAWERVRLQMITALEVYGTFEAVYDRLEETRKEVFSTAMNELYKLPTETKKKNVSKSFSGSYIGHFPNDSGEFDYESVLMDSAATFDGAETFTRTLWPEGNQIFRDTTLRFTKRMEELLEIIQKMILESYGVKKENQKVFFDSIDYFLRLAKYSGDKAFLPTHTDMNYLNVICQNDAGGLTVQLPDGQWVSAPLFSLTVVVGDCMEALTNGRLKPAPHTVKSAAEVDGRGGTKRYSLFMGSLPREGTMVAPPPEMVDADHPLLFKPFEFGKYVDFKFSPEGAKAAALESSLLAFAGAGVGADDGEA